MKWNKILLGWSWKNVLYLVKWQFWTNKNLWRNITTCYLLNFLICFVELLKAFTNYPGRKPEQRRHVRRDITNSLDFLMFWGVDTLRAIHGYLPARKPLQFFLFLSGMTKNICITPTEPWQWHDTLKGYNSQMLQSEILCLCASHSGIWAAEFLGFWNQDFRNSGIWASKFREVWNLRFRNSGILASRFLEFWNLGIRMCEIL